MLFIFWLATWLLVIINALILFHRILTGHWLWIEAPTAVSGDGDDTT